MTCSRMNENREQKNVKQEALKLIYEGLDYQTGRILQSLIDFAKEKFKKNKL